MDINLLKFELKKEEKDCKISSSSRCLILIKADL